MNLHTGITEQQRQTVADGMAHLLADTYTLYLKTQNFHWNVKGPFFQQLHDLFQTQYTELALAIDEIAERIRALGFRAPGTYMEFARLTSIHEVPGVPPAEEMLRMLLAGQETILHTARNIMPGATESGDEVSVDLLTQRMQAHEKAAWMLRSCLEI